MDYKKKIADSVDRFINEVTEYAKLWAKQTLVATLDGEPAPEEVTQVVAEAQTKIVKEAKKVAAKTVKKLTKKTKRVTKKAKSVVKEAKKDARADRKAEARKAYRLRAKLANREILKDADARWLDSYTARTRPERTAKEI